MTNYRNYDQEQLNSQFNIRRLLPDYADYFNRWQDLGKQAINAYKNSGDIAFGDFPQENLEIFPAEHPGAKTLVFIHGGYWHLLDKAMFYFLAPPFLKYNITLVFLNYRQAPEASMDAIVASCSKGIDWVHQNISSYNGDPSQLYVMGHSAGAQLATMLMTETRFNYLKGIIALSGLYRLEPVRLSYLNEVLQLDPTMADHNSPLLLEPRMHCPLLLATGNRETKEFLDQGREFYQHWKPKCSHIELLEIKDRNHYSIIDAISDDVVLKSAVFRLMDITDSRSADVIYKL